MKGYYRGETDRGDSDCNLCGPLRIDGNETSCINMYKMIKKNETMRPKKAL